MPSEPKSAKQNIFEESHTHDRYADLTRVEKILRRDCIEKYGASGGITSLGLIFDNDGVAINGKKG